MKWKASSFMTILTYSFSSHQFIFLKRFFSLLLNHLNWLNMCEVQLEQYYCFYNIIVLHLIHSLCLSWCWKWIFFMLYLSTRDQRLTVQYDNVIMYEIKRSLNKIITTTAAAKKKSYEIEWIDDNGSKRNETVEDLS